MPPPAEPGILDRATLLKRLGGKEERLRRIVELFLAESERLMGEMREAIAAGAAIKLRQAAHSLKGAIGVFGTTPAVQTAQKLESSGQAGMMNDASQLYAVLEKELNQLKPALAGFLAGPGGSSLAP